MLAAFILMLLPLSKNIKKILRAGLVKELLAISFAVLGLASTGIWGYFYVNNLIKLIGLAIYALAIIACFKIQLISSYTIVTACRIIITIHSFLFIVQLVYYIATKQYLDITNIVRDSEADALYLTNALEGSWHGIRATGVFTEPSFYAMTVLSASACIMAITRKLTPAVVVAIVTACISLSVAAMIISALLVTLLIFKSKETKLTRSLLLATAVSVAPAFYAFYDAKVSHSADYDAIASRLVVVDEIINRDFVQNLFGTGVLWDDRKPIGKSLLTGYHIRDSSFYVYLLYTAGIAGLAMYLFCLSRICKGNIYFALAISCLMLFKFHILHGVFWLVLVFAYISSAERRRRLEYSKVSKATIDLINPYNNLSLTSSARTGYSGLQR